MLSFLRCYGLLVIGFWGGGILCSASQLTSWQQEALVELCIRYVGEAPPGAADGETARAWADRLSKSIGQEMVSGGLRGVPAGDVAMLALLQARLADGNGSPAASPLPAPAAAGPAEPPGGNALTPTDRQESLADIGKGQEGFQQGVERLNELPLSERMVVTGDVNAGVQAISVPQAPNMSTTFGRFRLNVVARAVPGTPDGKRSEGYFFLQLRAAGGQFDSTSVGRPPAFSPFNDIATDRSLFNEGLNRGNFYLGKAYYQQEFRFGENNKYALLGQVGVVDFSDFFDMNEFANNEVRQFLNSAFVNAAAYKTAVGAPGAVGEFRRDLSRKHVTGMALRAGYSIARTDRVFSSPIWNGEVELRTLLDGRAGNWRFGGSIGNVADAGGFQTFYTSVDQWVSRKLGVFGRFVINNQGPGSLSFGPPRASLSGGVQRRFVGAGDYVSALGLGFSTAWGIETAHPLQPEHVLETYYRWQITRNFALTPDFQIVNGAGGASGTHVLAGIRANFGF